MDSLHAFLLLALPLAARAASDCFIACRGCDDARVRRGARDVQRHLYIQTGALCAMVDDAPLDDIVAQYPGGGVVVGSTHPAIARELDGATDDETHTVVRLDAGANANATAPIIHVAGTTHTATMHGCYTLLEALGVRFRVDGDVVDDARVRAFATPGALLAGAFPRGARATTLTPSFDRRGLQPPVNFLRTHFFRSNALQCTATARILIPAERSAVP